MGGFTLRCLRDYFSDDSVKSLRIVFCEDCEDLSVYDDILLLDHAHELAV